MDLEKLVEESSWNFRNMAGDHVSNLKLSRGFFLKGVFLMHFAYLDGCSMFLLHGFAPGTVENSWGGWTKIATTIGTEPLPSLGICLEPEIVMVPYGT